MENESGYRKLIDPHNTAQRESLAKTLLTSSSNGLGSGEGSGTKFVYRHLINGDPMLLNRQPTLHKPSIMSHKCVVWRPDKKEVNDSNMYGVILQGPRAEEHEGDAAALRHLQVLQRRL